MNWIKQVQDIVDKKLKSKENNDWNLDYKINRICNYSKDKILEIFKKFSKQVYPIYWFQKDSFLKLLNKWDRTTFILEVDWKEIWVLAFKDELQKEDNVIDSNKWYIEIKSFFLFDGFWKWNIWFLWNEFIKYIKENYSDADGSYVTISETKANPSLKMFKKIWFQELYSVHNEYSNDNSLETHLYLPLDKKQKINKIKLPIKKEYFDLIKQGVKTIEWRSWKNYNNIKIWDIIEFKNWNKIIIKKVKYIIRYSTIEDFLENEWIENTLPWITDINQAIDIYKNIPWYNQKIKKFWIIAFKF
jgi:ASC-1-like (ASCH) protein